MEVFTQEPGIQFYGRQFMAGTNPLRQAEDDYAPLSAGDAALSDSPNEQSFLPGAEAGKLYKTETSINFP